MHHTEVYPMLIEKSRHDADYHHLIIVVVVDDEIILRLWFSSLTNYHNNSRWLGLTLKVFSCEMARIKFLAKSNADQFLCQCSSKISSLLSVRWFADDDELHCVSKRSDSSPAGNKRGSGREHFFWSILSLSSSFDFALLTEDVSLFLFQMLHRNKQNLLKN